MASYTLLSSYTTVQVLSPTLASEGLYCTIQSAPSGSIVQRFVPQASFDSDQGRGLLESLATAIEDVISGGTAISASGSQEVDDSGLLADVVVFVVEYTPPTPTVGALTTTVSVPVNVLTADTSFGSFLTGGTALERIQSAHDKLAAMAAG